MKRLLICFFDAFFGVSPRFFVACGGVWRLRKRVVMLHNKGGLCRAYGNVLGVLIKRYWESYGSFVGNGAVIEEPPVFPHGPLGVFISSKAHIGKKVVIFQQVTIGSNTLRDSKGQGAPNVDDGVFIGCGAKIIGKVHVGKNSRIGANCVVVKDVPANSVTVIRGVESVVKEKVLDNSFISIRDI